jgi:hypothetical protein
MRIRRGAGARAKITAYPLTAGSVTSSRPRTEQTPARQSYVALLGLHGTPLLDSRPPSNHEQ